MVTKHRPMWRTSWEYMFKHWLAYGENNPEKRNKVSLRLEPKLNNWVKEQRRHFSNDTLKLDRFNKLDAAGFIFQLCACHGRKTTPYHSSSNEDCSIASAINAESGK